ncbi:MAG: alpha/beta fold hydrolase [Streptosporangiales bacterium]|nr:alpha/beta fold hydrolase [Streptosporangiales bacterium]
MVGAAAGGLLRRGRPHAGAGHGAVAQLGTGLSAAAARTVRTEDGVELFAEEYGPPDAPLSVVLLHGWTLDRRVWQLQVRDLPDRLGAPVRLVTYDHRGHGRSGATPRDRMTIAQLGDDLGAVLRTAAPAGPVVLAGHSIGGMAIMALAERHPALFAELVAGVAFVNTSSGGLADVNLGLPQPLARLAGRVESAVGRALVQGPSGAGSGLPGVPSVSGGSGGTGGIGGIGGIGLGGARHVRVRGALARRASRVLVSRPGFRWLLFGSRPPRTAVSLAVATVAATTPETIVGFRSTFADHDRRDALAACRGLPAVVLGGTTDRLCPAEHARAIAAELAGAELVLCPRAGHILPLERPDEVTDNLATVVKRALG